MHLNVSFVTLQRLKPTRFQIEFSFAFDLKIPVFVEAGKLELFFGKILFAVVLD